VKISADSIHLGMKAISNRWMLVQQTEKMNRSEERAMKELGSLHANNTELEKHLRASVNSKKITGLSAKGI
jgi:hypothetical protein